MKKKYRILFVCLGNICRSPAGEGILKHLSASKNRVDIFVDSCGIGDWHTGSLPDYRMQEAAKARGIALTGKAKQFRPPFFDEFDLILAADHEVMRDLQVYAKTANHKAKIHLMTEFSPTYRGQEIPDPYLYAGGAFDLVLDMLEDSCEGLLSYLKENFSG